MQARHSVNLLLMIILTSCFAKPAEKTGLEGKSMPSFNLLLLDSSSYINTNNIPAGKPTVLFYFGSDCPYSHAQMEEIIEDIDVLKDIRFLIFTSGSFSGTRVFNEKFHLNRYHNITVGLDYAHVFADYFEAPGVPYTAVYGKDKKLNAVFVGKVYGKQIKNSAEK